MGMSKNISNFINSINDKRIASAFQKVINQTQPIGLDTAITAYAGGGQANARVLRQDCAFHDVTTVATAADSVALPNALVGEFHFVKNSAALKMQVYAPTPGTIDSVATGTGVVQEPGDAVLYVCLVHGNYIRLGGVQATEAFGDITVDNLTMANPIVYDHNTTITAFATGGQGSATALTGEFNNVTTCATSGDSVKLPAAALGKSITVKNSGAASLAVFPATGDAINALAVNLSVNVPVGATTEFRAIDATTYETNEVFVSPAPTTQRGEFVFKASDNAADHEVILTNASHGQATTHTLPDPGATGTIVLEEIANVFDVPQRYDSNTTITAFATGGQASATALTGEINTVTVCATANDSVKLPAAAAGLRVTVRNLGAAICAVFPATGDAINALAADLSISLPVLGEITFQAIDGTTWYTQRAIGLPAPTTQRGNFVMKVADNAANYEVSFVNASHGQATTHTVPDGGAATDYGVYSTAAITLVEADVLDGATQGAGVASKAVVLNSSGDFSMADGDFFNLSSDTLAAAGSTAADAAALVDQITTVTGADGVKGVVLPAAADLLQYTAINDSPVYAVKVWPVNAGNDVINELAADEAFLLAPGRSVTFKAISATQWYADKDAAEPTKETHFEVFDDFLKAALDTTDNWITFDGTTAAAQPATTVTAPEGQVTMINGAANDAQDKSVMSLILLAKGALISLGKTVFETRVSFGAVTGCSWGFGLGDVLANATEVANYTVNSGVVADDAGIANAISFVFDTDATAVDKWQFASTNAGTVGNAGVEEAAATGPVANTYTTLRIEVDASGDARFYINGALVESRPTAVATTALLIPYIWGDSAVDAQTAVTVAIDYIKFQGARPSSNA